MLNDKYNIVFITKYKKWKLLCSEFFCINLLCNNLYKSISTRITRGICFALKNAIPLFKKVYSVLSCIYNFSRLTLYVSYVGTTRLHELILGPLKA